jgi:hypothetical protein
MFQRMIDNFGDSIASSIRQSSLAAATALALFITLCFLCAAGFVYVLQTYGPIQACLTGAGVFFVITLIVAAVYTSSRKQKPQRAKRAARDHDRESPASPLQGLFADPMLVATGLQLVKAIGVKRLIPLLAIGGLALGILASRGGASAGDDETPET